jgi:nitrate/TMAO reductase-like tetraheme cytochrome c subunit
MPNGEPPRVSRFHWLFGWRTLSLFFVGWGVAIGGLLVTNRSITYAGTNEFCGTACHTMKPAYDSYQRSVHFTNAAGVRASCSDCHIPYESARNNGGWQWLQLVAFKARVGLTDAVSEFRGTISTQEKWKTERPRLGKQVHEFVQRNDSLTCRGCHDLRAFSTGTMQTLVHDDSMSAKKVDCVSCHAGMGHVYGELEKGAAIATGAAAPHRQAATPAPLLAGAQDGAAQYRTSCASCHGSDGKTGTAIAGDTAAKVTRVLDSHSPPMTDLKLTATQISAVANYVAGMK